MAKRPIYQFYAELDDFKPKIWRRFQVKGDITVARLGYITQVLFEMTASHLMAIEVPIDEISREHYKANFPDKEFRSDLLDGGEKIWRFEIPSDDEPFDDFHRNITVMDATQTKLSRLTSEPNFWLNLNYDFGDDWWVTLKLEDVFEDDRIVTSDLPHVIEGSGFGIVEDVGGTSGLSELAKAFKKKKGAAYKEFSEWLGISDFDITAFDLDDMNFRLKKIPRIYKQCYEDRAYPTQKSIDLIERKYLKK